MIRRTSSSIASVVMSLPFPSLAAITFATSAAWCLCCVSCSAISILARCPSVMTPWPDSLATFASAFCVFFLAALTFPAGPMGPIP